MRKELIFAGAVFAVIGAVHLAFALLGKTYIPYRRWQASGPLEPWQLAGIGILTVGMGGWAVLRGFRGSAQSKPSARDDEKGENP